MSGPPAEEVNEADQYAYLGAKEAEMPELGTCYCDAAPYLHLSGVIPGTEDRQGREPVRVCLVVQNATKVITVLRITGGGSPD